MVTTEATCEQCKRTFIPKMPNRPRRYCSNLCEGRAKYTRRAVLRRSDRWYAESVEYAANKFPLSFEPEKPLCWWRPEEWRAIGVEP